MSPKHKPAALTRQAPSAKATAAKSNWIISTLVIASIAVVILGIILLKDRQQPAVALSAVKSSIPAGVTDPVRSVLPADQLREALAQGRPAVVFMHSTSCQSCIDMMKVVDQVHPEFAGQVTLVDVDVHDDANGPLMQMLGLRYIPTVVVFNSQGQTWQNVGLMKPDAFRAFLRQHALGN